MSPEEQTGSNPDVKSVEALRGKVLLPDEVLANLKGMARAATERSYSPYSNFPVGAAVLASSGKIYSGSNVENASYGLSVCAERVAISSAVSAGEETITGLAVYTSSKEPCPPCGACLAVMSEFAGEDAPILMFSEGKERRSTLGQLLPQRFKLNPKERK